MTLNSEACHADDCAWNKTRITLQRRCTCGALAALPTGDLVERLNRIATMAQVAIDTGGREDFDPRGVEDGVLEAAARIQALEQALKQIADICPHEIEGIIARAALNPEVGE